MRQTRTTGPRMEEDNNNVLDYLNSKYVLYLTEKLLIFQSSSKKTCSRMKCKFRVARLLFIILRY